MHFRKRLETDGAEKVLKLRSASLRRRNLNRREYFFLPHLEHVSDLIGRLLKVALVDRGYKGRKTILGVEIMMPVSGKGKTAYEKLRD